MDFEKIVRTAGKILVVAALVLLLTTISNIAMYVTIFDWIKDGIESSTGWDSGLCKAWAAVVTAVFSIVSVWMLIMAFSPIPQENKGAYRFFAILCIAAIFFFKYLASNDVYFDKQTGFALKYYIVCPDGSYKFSSDGGYDPEYGIKREKVTREIILKSKGLYNDPSKQLPSYRAPYVPPVQPRKIEEPIPEPIQEPVKPRQDYNVQRKPERVERPPSEDKEEKAEIKETPHYEPDYFKEPQRVDPYLGRSRTHFMNVGNSAIVVENSNLKDLFVLSGGQEKIMYVPYGLKFYYRPYGGRQRNSFVIPNAREFRVKMEIEKVARVARGNNLPPGYLPSIRRY